MESNRHVGWLGAVAAAIALGSGLAGCDRGGSDDTTAAAPGGTAASAVISGSGISPGTSSGSIAGTTTASPGAMVGTYPPGAVAPASSSRN